MIYEIRKKEYRSAKPGEDFGDYDYVLVDTIEASSLRAAQTEFKKGKPTLHFGQNGRYVCWEKR